MEMKIIVLAYIFMAICAFISRANIPSKETIPMGIFKCLIHGVFWPIVLGIKILR